MTCRAAWLHAGVEWGRIRRGEAGQDPLRTLRATYVNSRAETRARVWHEPPRNWRLLTEDEPASGVVTDGVERIVVRDGVAVVRTRTGVISMSHILELNLLRPRGFRFPDTVDSLVDGERQGREVWVARWSLTGGGPEVDGHDAAEAVYDVATGIVLEFSVDGDVWYALDDVVTNQELPAGTFGWAGPDACGGRVGVVGCYECHTEDDGRVVEHSGRFDLVHEVTTPVGSWYEHARRPLAIGEALAWARERADRVLVRVGVENPVHYSAGTQQFDDPLPAWPPES